MTPVEYLKAALVEARTEVTRLEQAIALLEGAATTPKPAATKPAAKPAKVADAKPAAKPAKVADAKPPRGEAAVLAGLCYRGDGHPLAEGRKLCSDCAAVKDATKFAVKSVVKA